ncbi:winged helix-turn-helix transcriptional regulator [Arthrobacter gengyunqii]|uniref:winged helix-turn-helix transcriptional regulator n=1 Tax=Arthrobacter gengyunqii TaxID=2886940 RepID=UPI003C2E595A
MSYVGERWTILILRDCFDGYTRFDQFRANIGLSSSMLTARLKSVGRQRHPGKASLPGQAGAP